MQKRNYLTRKKVFSATKVVKRISPKTKGIAEYVLSEVKEERRQENLRLAREFEDADLIESSIAIQNKMLERQGFDIKDINKLREKIETGKINEIEEIADELDKLKEKKFIKNVIKNKGVFKKKQ